MNKTKRQGRKEKVKAKVKVKVKPRGPRGLSQYLKEVRLELRKVFWPSRQEVTVSTAVVIVAVILFAIYVSLLDIGFSTFVKSLSSLFQK